MNDEEKLYTETELNSIMYEHDKQWFELKNKSERRHFIIILILLCFIIGFFTFKEIMYYKYPAVKSQITITDTNGIVQDIKQGSEE